MDVEKTKKLLSDKGVEMNEILNDQEVLEFLTLDGVSFNEVQSGAKFRIWIYLLTLGPIALSLFMRLVL